MATFTGTYGVTQADINHGSVVDHATTRGTTPANGSVNNSSNTVTVTATRSPSLSIAKSATPTTVTAAGESVAYTFTVVNTGNVTLTGVGVTDLPSSPAGGVTVTCLSLSNPTGTCSGAATTLVPGQIATFTGTYTVTQVDVDHGSIADSAMAAGTSPADTPVTAASNPVIVDVPRLPSLSIAKAADPTTVTAAGQSVTYTFTVTNTGNVTLTDVGVTDNPTQPAGTVAATCRSLSTPADTCSGATTTLLPGQTAIFSGPYTVTQADVNHGEVVDDATANGDTAYRNRGHGHVQLGHGDRDPVGLHRHRQDRVPHHSDGGRPDRHLHLHGHQHRERDPDRCRCDRQPHAARRNHHGNLPRVSRTRAAPARARPRPWSRARSPSSPARTR